MQTNRKTIELPRQFETPKTLPASIPTQHPLRAEYLTTKDLASVLSTPEPVVRQSRVDGKLFGRKAPEYVRIGERKLLYEASTIRDWIAAGKRGTVVGAEK